MRRARRSSGSSVRTARCSWPPPTPPIRRFPCPIRIRSASRAASSASRAPDLTLRGKPNVATCKTVLIGAGSFVFGPSMLSQTLLEHRLDDLHLALVDVDGEVAELMAGVGR